MTPWDELKRFRKPRVAVMAARAPVHFMRLTDFQEADSVRRGREPVTIMPDP
jgi:hypothetical protein